MSDHFDGRRFFNPIDPRGRALRDVLMWMFTRKKQPWPKWVDDPPQPGPPPSVAGDALAVTFVNHDTFLLQMQGLNILTDPIWSDRASPFTWTGPRRVRLPGVPFDRLPVVDVVLVSHNHYDHLDLPTLRRLQTSFRPLYLTGLGNACYLKARGLVRVEELDWWESARVGEAVEISLTPAQHFSARGLFDVDRTLWGGFLIAASNRKVYFAGDTAYPGAFAEIRRRAGTLDLALLPIGAYEPRWFMRAAHMNPEEAVQAHLDLGGPYTLGMHFGTFQLTDEPIDEPERHLRRAMAQRGVPETQFHVPRFGETVYLPPE